MPKKNGIYLIMATSKSFSIVDLNMKIEDSETKQKDLVKERNKLAKISILSNMQSDSKEMHELYRSRKEIEVASDAMKNKL